MLSGKFKITKKFNKFHRNNRIKWLFNKAKIKTSSNKNDFLIKSLATVISFLVIPYSCVCAKSKKEKKPPVSPQVVSVTNKDDNSKVKSLTKMLIALGIGTVSTAADIAEVIIYRNSDNAFQRSVIGDTAEIRKTYYDVNDLPGGMKAKPITVDSGLKGYIYSSNSNKNGKLAGKYVIFYSGSGCTNSDQAREVALKYVNEGAIVVGVDYSGFGNSGQAVSSGTIRQKNIYSDAKKIYNYVENNLKIKKSNIILHGYSLGGPVAAHVAADVSGGADKLGGLVLQSPVKNTSNAAYSILKKQNSGMRYLGAACAWLFTDSFNCKKELIKLHKEDPNIPIILGGGNSSDHLNLSNTGLPNIVKQIGFNNIKICVGNKGHMENGCAPAENFSFPVFKS